ncbi:MAG: protein kinase [Longimicrobiales bacterium]|nr:protein kinase [Longimicrobiales bacterium]
MPEHTPRLSEALQDRYRIEHELGEGGMATVYLAQDLKHNRPVALKVLKPELAAVVGAERFLAEIETTANLQHPHILPLFDSGEADGFLYYVMPYVEGETLRERLDREGQLSVEEAVRYVSDVAEALGHAHRRGVVHRDIKPANILIQDGRPVVADFGVALAVGSAGGARLTETGLSVGTPYYMSPEQAMGDASVSAASDIYALACVLYELLAGEPPFTAGTAQAVLAKIITGGPPSVLDGRPAVPRNVDAAIRCALERVPTDRFPSAEAFREALADPDFRYGEAPAAAGEQASRRLRLVTAGALALAVVATAAAVAAFTRPVASPGASRVLTQELTLGIGAPQAAMRSAEVSSDGRWIVHTVNDQRGVQSLYVRQVTEQTARPLPGTSGAWRFGISPTSEEVAFNQVGLGPLKVVSLQGGPVRVLAERAIGWPVWSRNHIYFVNEELGISRVPIEGGEVERVTPVTDDGLVRAPTDVLPAGSALIFTEFYRGEEGGRIRALSLESGEMKTLAHGAGGVFRGGLLVFAPPSQDRLMAVAIDPETLEVSGETETVATGLASVGPLYGGVNFYLSRSGDLIYSLARQGEENVAQPVWVDRSGNVTAITAEWRVSPEMSLSALALSHDGTRLAASSKGAGANRMELFVYDLRGGPLQRLAFDEPVSTRPFWSPDDREVYYFEDPSGSFLEGNLVARRADGSGDGRTIVPDVGIGDGAWGQDGDWMVFRGGVPARPSRDILALRAGSSEPIELVATDATEQAPSLSPDGRWLLYQSDRTGQHEVYVRPFPEVDTGLLQISLDGGTEPHWARSGREIFYRNDEGRMVAVQVEPRDGDLRMVRHDLLFDATPFWSDPASQQYDVAPDDQRFLMLRGEGSPNRLIVTWNWLEQARTAVPEANR